MITHEAVPDEEGENYFVSMTDIMVGLLFVFIIMLMTFALNYRERQDVSEEDIRRLRQAIAVVDDRIEAVRRVAETRARFLEQLERELVERGVRVQADTGSGVLRLPEAILFQSDRSELTPSGRAAIATLGDVLAGVLPCYLGEVSSRPASCPAGQDVAIEAVFVEGHADASGGATAVGLQRNWDLSVNRSTATYRELERHAPGVAALQNGRRERVFSVSGYGQFRPFASNDTAEGRAANRRIDLRFIMQTDQQRALREIRDELARILRRP